MQYEATTPKEYIETLPEDWRKKKLLEVRSMVLKNGPKLIECIEYKMLGFAHGDKCIMHLNAQKNYVSLYVGNIEKIKNGPKLLADFNLGKGCIRIKKSNVLSETHLNYFIELVIKKYHEGGNTDC